MKWANNKINNKSNIYISEVEGKEINKQEEQKDEQKYLQKKKQEKIERRRLITGKGTKLLLFFSIFLLSEVHFCPY